MSTTLRSAAIYARVSSEQQREAQTIGSQTSAVRAFAKEHGYFVPEEWVFEDEGYSGSLLVRPGLERIRDLAAEGQIEAVLAHSPDRLSRKYAYQVLLLEEFSRRGVDVVFVNSPPARTPEEQLLVQFQGMIAEYERAQIVERCRRGKRYRARSGLVNVLSGAPYGYRYVKKSDEANAYYEINEAEADVVRMVYDLYTSKMQSMGQITRQLNDTNVPTRKGVSRWERSTVWAILRNPAYIGKACFGKTRQTTRKRITRRLRLKGGHSPRCSSSMETPRAEWLEIPVPPLVLQDVYALAQEKLATNKKFAARRTKEPTLLQGLLVCRNCGYAYYRASTRTTLRKIYYYRCLGSDDYRYEDGRVCHSTPLRQDFLDDLVWRNVISLLENPSLVEAEINRRIDVMKSSSGAGNKRGAVEKEAARTQCAIQRLLDAYQESLLSIDELRNRTNELRKRQKSLQAQLHSLEMAEAQEETYFRIVHSLKGFLAKLNSNRKALSITEKQKVVRAVIKEVQVDGSRIHIVHSIPLSPAAGEAPGNESESYRLCLGSYHSPLRTTLLGIVYAPLLLHSCLQPLTDHPCDHAIAYPLLDKFTDVRVLQRVEVLANVHFVHPALLHVHRRLP
jgi:site-specific DNA recombinase